MGYDAEALEFTLDNSLQALRDQSVVIGDQHSWTAHYF